jgi:hypothetical protein
LSDKAIFLSASEKNSSLLSAGRHNWQVWGRGQEGRNIKRLLLVYLCHFVLSILFLQISSSLPVSLLPHHYPPHYLHPFPYFSNFPNSSRHHGEGVREAVRKS